MDIKRSVRFSLALLFTGICLCCNAYNGFSQNQTTPGVLKSLYPTLVNLAVEWQIIGDDNGNGLVSVQFRELGSKNWQTAMPLRRVPAGENNTALTLDRNYPGYNGFHWENKHSGSLFNLKPGTPYQIRLSLADPDGGDEVRIITAQTRPIPKIDANSNITEIAPGTYDTLHTTNGTAEHPHIYQCSKGTATFKYIDVQNRSWVYIVGLNVENLTKEGRGVCLTGASNCVVSHCTINAVWGIVAYLPGLSNSYISDNTITGTSGWNNESMGAHGKNIGEGIEITGPGNVICFNKVSGFRDCISTMEDEYASNQTSIDIYNNDIYLAADDGIEADFCFSNCRIFNNRLTNCFVGLSSQPGLGGPTYFIRNVMYNMVHGAFKLKRNSRGDVVLHNTVIKVGTGLGGNSAMDYAYFRNNLAIGGPSFGINWGGYGAGKGYAANIIEPGMHSDFDYDAVGVVDTSYVSMIGNKPFIEIEKHGVANLSFSNVFPGIKFPNPEYPVLIAPDLMPSAGSKVYDAAIRIPNINDGFKGKAPDCGAYEVGQVLPHYGPRPRISRRHHQL